MLISLPSLFQCCKFFQRVPETLTICRIRIRIRIFLLYHNVKNNKITSNVKKTRDRAAGNCEGTQGLRVKRLPGLINEQFYSISTNKSVRRNLGFNYAYIMISIAKTVQVYNTHTLNARNNI